MLTPDAETRSDFQEAIIAFGPEMAGIGSWEWIGKDIAAELSGCFRTVTWSRSIPACDVVVFVKYCPPLDLVRELAEHSAVVLCPVDLFGSTREIDASAQVLRYCNRVIVHYERLRRYFEPYASVETMDHHVKYVAEQRPAAEQPDPYILWVGMNTHLPILTDWLARHPLPLPLRVLTNFSKLISTDPLQIGFRDCNVQIAEWSPALHIDWTAGATAALDLKGDDFRQRHKPPTKAIDFIASGLPLAMNPESSAVVHLARMGFEVASPLNIDWWLSQDYREETSRFGGALRELLTRRRIGLRYKRIFHEVLRERRR